MVADEAGQRHRDIKFMKVTAVCSRCLYVVVYSSVFSWFKLVRKAQKAHSELSVVTVLSDLYEFYTTLDYTIIRYCTIICYIIIYYTISHYTGIY